MATIVNNPGERGDSSAGWAVAVIILLVVIAGVGFWYLRGRSAAPAATPGANIQVNIPTPGGNSGGEGGSAPAPAQ